MLVRWSNKSLVNPSIAVSNSSPGGPLAMQTVQQHTRARPRVSRACERCRIKKAKCDGERPCRRCNLDSALCSYRAQRKPLSASATQRYMNLLLQQHSALTAGVLALYSNLLNGERWEGLPVMEVDGSPSVHCILERLGVISADEEFDESLAAIDSYDDVQLLPIREVHVVPKAQKGTKPSKKSRDVPPLSATSSSSTVPTTSWYEPDSKVSCVAHVSQVSSPSSHESSQSPTFEATSCSTPSTGDPTSYAGGLFLSPAVPTTTLCDVPSQDQLISQPATFPDLRPGPVAPGFVMDPNRTMQLMANPLFENGCDMFGTENFADATCGMTFYDRETAMYGNGNMTGGLPTTIPQDYSQWIPGVLL